MNDFPICRTLALRDLATGELTPLFCGISLPFQTETGEFGCNVYVAEGLYDPRPVFGVDPVQAVTIALTILESILRMNLSGQEVCWPSGSKY